MEKQINNPQAFPAPDTVNENGRYEPLQQGMTLRDYFAAKAMNGLLSNENIQRPHPKYGELAPQYESFARITYEYADAMLKERSK